METGGAWVSVKSGDMARKSDTELALCKPVGRVV